MGFACKPRGAAFVVLAGALLLGLSTTSTPASAADPYPTLGGTTLVRTSTSGVATLRLTDPVTLDFKHFFTGPPVLEGTGRLNAMVLEKGGIPYVAFATVQDCSTPGCTGSGFNFDFPVVLKRHLDAGLYNLYVVADGGPVSIKLSLPGLTGTTELKLQPDHDIVAQDFAALLPTSGAGVDPAVYTANAGATIGEHGGMLLSQSFITTANFVAVYWGHCATSGAPPIAYLPGCSLPPGTQTANDLSQPYAVCYLPYYCDPLGTAFEAANGVPGGDVGLAVATIPAAGAGPWSQGVYYQGAALVTSATSTGVWLSYAAPEGAPVTPSVATPSGSASPSASAAPTDAPLPAVIGLPNTSSGTGAAAPFTAVAVAGLLLVWRRSRRVARVARQE